MNDLNEIGTMKADNCTIHICNNSIAEKEEEQKKIWNDFSEKAYKLYTRTLKNVEK